MSKLYMTCACGQEMVVPASAIGRAGLCPGCGIEVTISAENTREYTPPRRTGSLLQKRVRAKSGATQEESWRKFATAVDLYHARRYAESLTLLNVLIEDFPGNANVEAAREQCLAALQQAMSDERMYNGKRVDTECLNETLVHSVLLEKMLYGGSESVQLQAAEMTARMLGMFGNANGHGNHDARIQKPAPEDGGDVVDSQIIFNEWKRENR